ncbi:MAG TPA: GNAT family N-acetyltransferase [Polyangiaceae bacterium]
MKLSLRIAATRAEALRCQYLIAQIYNEEYEVLFSDDRYDLTAKIEPWPHRYLMGIIDGELACASGLYLRDTYVERFGDVREGDVRALVAEAGAGDRYGASPCREITKVVVHKRWRGRGLGRAILAAAHTVAFLEQQATAPPLVVFCAKLSIVRNLWDAIGVRSRTIKPFPFYKVHELYRTDADPMESRLVIPALDIPPRWYDLAVPGEYPLETLGGRR